MNVFHLKTLNWLERTVAKVWNVVIMTSWPLIEAAIPSQFLTYVRSPVTHIVSSLTIAQVCKGPHVHLPVTYFFVPRHNLSFDARAFRVSAPEIWNSIPLHSCQFQTDSLFRRHLKTYYTFSQPILPPSSPIMRPDSFLRLWRCINPLLTYFYTLMTSFRLARKDASDYCLQHNWTVFPLYKSGGAQLVREIIVSVCFAGLRRCQLYV